MIFDSHCHLYDEKLHDKLGEILEITDTGELACVCSADNVKNSQKALDIATKHKNIYATIGTHPHDAIDFENTDLEIYKNLAKNKKVVAVGEIGLDYYYDKAYSNTQKEVLKKQIILADELSLPCVFHIREAMGDFLQILDEMKGYFRNSGVIHSFSGSVETAEQLVSMGFYLGINGICTFKNANKILDVIRAIPLENLLIETDSPYLAPVPHRGEANTPMYVTLVAEKIAELKSVTSAEVIQKTCKNAKHVFRIED